MVGSPSNGNNTRVLSQWYQLFTDQGFIRSVEACAHWRHVECLGLPTNKQEHWKYTSLDGFLAHHFVPATMTRMVSVDIRDALSLTLDAYRLVFVDGRFISALSDGDTGQWQVRVEKDIIHRALPDPIQPEVFLHLTESLSQEITWIYLPMGEVAQRPLYLLHISQSSEDKTALSTLHYRHHVNIDTSANGQVIEHFTSVDAHGHFSGARTTLVVGDNAQLRHFKLAFESRASYHFGHNDITLGRNAMVNSHAIILGAGLTRHQTSVQMNGEGSNVALNSLLLPSKQDISDVRTYLEHNKGYCSSYQLHKIIARDHGRGVFNGLIKVAKCAIKTDGQMINNNLLLDRWAEVNSKLQLEIYADDVQCRHGATVGQINKEQIFYLCSRGISLDVAQQMIIYVFATEVTKSINCDKVRNAILVRVVDALLWEVA